jgi:hypothetical protein
MAARIKHWCGGFVLDGTVSIHKLLGCNATAIEGNFLENQHFMSDLRGPGTYAMFQEPDKTESIVTKSITVPMWCTGPTDTMAVIDRFVNLSKMGRYAENYATVIQKHVLVDPGCWSLTLATLGKTPVVVLASLNSVMYLWLVRFRGSFSILWSSDPEQLNHLFSEPDIVREDFLIIPLEIANSLCVLHPIFLIGRFRRAWFQMFKTDRLAVVSYMQSYIERRILTLSKP